jgi:nucleoside-diphosphate-sugar epimerase
VDIVEEIAGVKLKRTYKPDAPKGVNGRNSDNTRLKQYFDWEPSTRLQDGMAKTYEWIEKQILESACGPSYVAAAVAYSS